MKQTGLILLLGALFLCSCQDESLEGTDQANQGADKKEILWMIKTPDGTVPTKAVGVKGKYWGIGDTIRIKFLNGTAAFQQQVKQNAAIWLQYANLYFEYVGANDSADVKIGFDMDHRWLAWSMIGTDCKAVPQDQPSLNFVWLADEDAQGVKSEVLKGFGHVLGLGFEHKNPNSTLRFKPTADFEGEYNLTGTDVDALKDLYLTSQTNYTVYDRSSIMALTVPRGLVTAPNMATTRNSDLSDTDKEFIAGIYPQAVITMTYAGKGDVFICAGSEWYTPPTVLNSSRKVDWGDGTVEMIPKDNYYSHTYRDSALYKISFYGNDTSYRLFMSQNGARSIDVSKCKALKYLYSHNGFLSELDVSQNLNLVQLTCLGNKTLTSVNLKHNVKLESFECAYCPLDTIDVSNCPELYRINCTDSGVKYMILDSLNFNLEQLYCEGHGLSPKLLSDVASMLPNRTGLSRGRLFVTTMEEKAWLQTVCNQKCWDVNFSKSTSAYSANRQDVGRFPLPYGGIPR